MGLMAESGGKLDLSESVESLKGIGPKTAEILRKAGIRTLRDFFYNLPRDYENFQAATSIKEMRPGRVVIRGKIDSLTQKRARRRNLSIIEGVIRDNTGAVRVVWFNQSYRMRQFDEGKEYLFTGTYELKNGRLQLTSPSSAVAADVDMKSGLAPIYVAHGGIKSADFARFFNASRGKFASIPDLLPGGLARAGQRAEALYGVHFPSGVTEVAAAREYLAYEEVFELILASRLNRSENEKLRARKINFDAAKIREFVQNLPFRLTGAQRVAAWEIFQDMAGAIKGRGDETKNGPGGADFQDDNDTLECVRPMNRLLQGDVGSGKTMVAALAAYEAASSGAQVAILAPTAILAAQHFEGMAPMLAQYGIETALLTGGTKPKEKQELKRRILSGEVQVVIGTHALLTDDTEFNCLGLVIIDEQHRFGVEQRQKLMLKSPEGLAPHLLAMTATPIPRSLQLTIFGDLDVSILNEMPKGRQPIVTRILPEIEMKERLYPEILREVAAGRQAYWICKAIEDTEVPSVGSDRISKKQGSGGKNVGAPLRGIAAGVSEVTSVKARLKRLKEVFPKLRIEYLHGKMKPAEKDAVMEAFSRHEIDILVSTTVVEVGVNVPNATLIVIENAESYGLAQLHQLRGRVGRGGAKSYCFLLTSGDAKPSRRLRELEKSTDGFHLAEVDLKLRGPGEIYGALQHGALDLRIATLTDTRLIARARRDVEKFLQNPEDMVKYKELMDGIKKYQQITTLN